MKITTFPTYPDALDALAKELRARRFSPTEYRIVLTPDRYTLQAEKALFGGSGAIDCEVLTLSPPGPPPGGGGNTGSPAAGAPPHPRPPPPGR